LGSIKQPASLVVLTNVLFRNLPYLTWRAVDALVDMQAQLNIIAINDSQRVAPERVDRSRVRVPARLYIGVLEMEGGLDAHLIDPLRAFSKVPIIESIATGPNARSCHGFQSRLDEDPAKQNKRLGNLNEAL